VPTEIHQCVDTDVDVGRSVANVCRSPCPSAPLAWSPSMPARLNARSTRYCNVPQSGVSPQDLAVLLERFLALYIYNHIYNRVPVVDAIESAYTALTALAEGDQE